MNASVSGETIIWRLTDGKPGHESQSLGLAHALQRMRPCQLIDIPVSGKLAPFYQWLSVQVIAHIFRCLPPSVLMVVKQS